MTKQTLLLILLIFTSINAFSKGLTDSNLSGHVIDTKTGEHLPYVHIAIKGTTMGTVTDYTGHYLINNLPIGTYTVEASYIGYKSVQQTVTTIAGTLQELHFNLEEEDQLLDEVVVTSNRGETKRRESSSIVNVLSTKMFQITSSNNLSEALSYQPGLRVEQTCGNCGVPQLRINGLDGQYSQILLDSRPIFSSLSAVYGLEMLPAAMIERVEVIRGGGSALFGSNAIAGVVNIITKEPIGNNFTISNRTGVMPSGGIDANTMLNGSIVTQDYKSGLYLFSMLRNRDAYDRNGDDFSEVPTLTSSTIGFRGYHKFNDKNKITAEFHYMNEYRRGGDSLGRPPHEALIAEQLRHNIYGGSLKYDFNTRSLEHRVNVYAAGQGIDRESYFGTDKDPNAYGNTDDLTFNGGAQYTWNAAKLWFMPAQLIVGFESSYNKLNDQQLGYNRSTEQTTYTYGGYFQNEWKNKYLSLLIGGRLEKHNLINTPIFSPRMNVRYNPIQEVALRVSYAHGFRAPQVYDEDLHVAAVGGGVSFIDQDPNLRPEFSNSISASVDFAKRLSGLGQISFLAEGFFTHLSDQFSLVEKGTDDNGNLHFLRTNTKGVMVAGVNTEFKWENLKNINIQLGATFQKSKYFVPFHWSSDESVAPAEQLLRSPDYYGFASISYTLFKRLTLGTTLNVTGPMLIPHYAGYIEQDRLEKSTTFTDWGVKAAYEIPISKVVKLEVEIGAKNVLDQFQSDLDVGEKKDAKYIYGPALPRTIYAGLRIFL